MSLIVTSNIALDRPETADTFKPYSYQNALLNTMKIPANSEIALQSCKINKSGMMTVDKSNSRFNHFFGVPVGDATTPDIEHTTSQPFWARAGDGSFRVDRNVDDFATDIQTGIALAAFHPSLITGTETSGIKVTTEYEDTTLDFEGFKFVCTQINATTHKTAAFEFTDISTNESGHYTDNVNGTVTSTNAIGFQVQNRQYPIAQNAGEVIINFSDGGANTDTKNSPFWCGIGRINTKKDINARDQFIPETYNYWRGAGGGQPFRKNVANIYYDIGIQRVSELLHVYQSGVDTNTGELVMNEVTYWDGAFAAPFKSQYNLRTNTSNFAKVKFKLENEEISIYLLEDDDTATLLCDFTTLKAAGGTKINLPAPINACKWNMYPVMGLRGNAKALQLEKVKHYTVAPLYSSSNYKNWDFWGYTENTAGQQQWATELEGRFWNDLNDTTSGTTDDGLLVPQTLNASGGMANYKNILITAPSIDYGQQITRGANSYLTLGFAGRPIAAPNTTVNLINTIISNSVPQMTSNVSIFIRLNNFTQNTMNARQGTISKIVAHLPRFDNGGNEVGGLYFEPHEKTYLSLGNTDEILINSFDVDIVYDNEVMCKALTGKTIVCFHIRQKGDKN